MIIVIALIIGGGIALIGGACAPQDQAFIEPTCNNPAAQRIVAGCWPR